MVALCNYREDGVTPYFILWKDGLKGAFPPISPGPSSLLNRFAPAETKI